MPYCDIFAGPLCNWLNAVLWIYLVCLGTLTFITADSVHIFSDGYDGYSENPSVVTRTNDGCDSTECKFSTDSLQKPKCTLSSTMTIDAEPHSCRSSHENISVTRYPSAPAGLHINYSDYHDASDAACDTKTALYINWTAPNDGTQHLLTGFLLQIAHEEVDSVRITNRVFTLSGVDASTNIQLYYDCYSVNRMADYHVTVYSLPRSPNDTNSLHEYIPRAEPQDAYCWKTLISLIAVPQKSSVVAKYKLAPEKFGYTGYDAKLSVSDSRPWLKSTFKHVTNHTMCEVFSYSHATQDECLRFEFLMKLEKKDCHGPNDDNCRDAVLRANIFWSNSSTYHDGDLCDIRTTNSDHRSQSTACSESNDGTPTIVRMHCNHNERTPLQRPVVVTQTRHVDHSTPRTSLLLVTVDSASASTGVDDNQPGSAATVVSDVDDSQPSSDSQPGSAATGFIVLLIVVVFAFIVVVVFYVSRRSTCRNPTCRRLTAVVNGTSTSLHRLLLLDVSDMASSTKQPDDFVEQLALLLTTRCQCDVTRFQDDVIRNHLTSSKSIRRHLAPFAVIVVVHTTAARCHFDNRSNRNSGQPVDLYGQLLQHVMTLSSVHVYHVVFSSLFSTNICDDVSVRDETFVAVDSGYELWEDTERLIDNIQQSLLPVISDDEMKFIKLTCDALNDDYDRD